MLLLICHVCVGIPCLKCPVLFCFFFQESFEFKKPTKPASRCRGRSFNNGQSKDTFACRPSSAPALMVCEESVCKLKRGDLLLERCWLTFFHFYIKLSSPPPVQQLDFHDSSPMFLRSSSLTSSNDDEDDGFLDVLDDNMEVSPCHSCFYGFFFFFCNSFLSDLIFNVTHLLFAEWLWGTDGHGQLTHCPTGGWQYRRRLCKCAYFRCSM